LRNANPGDFITVRQTLDNISDSNRFQPNGWRTGIAFA